MKTRNSRLAYTAITALAALSLMPGFANASAAQDKYYSQILEEINTHTGHIDNATKSQVLALVQPSADLSETMATRQNMNQLLQAQSNLSHAVGMTLSQQYLGAETIADNVNQAYGIGDKNYGAYSSLSAYSLLGLSNTDNYYSVTYNKNQQQAASRYAAYLAGDALPIMKPKGDDKKLETRKAINAYRTLAAIQSLDAYNVSKYYASRTGMVGTNKPGLKQIKTPDGKISRLGLNRYLMLRKANDPKWYAQVQKESPYAVMRDGVALLAANLAELYQVEQNQEQMILTQTATNTATLAMIKKMNDMMSKANENTPSS